VDAVVNNSPFVPNITTLVTAVDDVTRVGKNTDPDTLNDPVIMG
jgi:hypothetical protein